MDDCVVEEKLLSFLYFGFDVTRGARLNESISRNKRRKVDHHNLIRRGIDAVRNTFKDEVSGTQGHQHIIPISGGLDSRAILGGVLQHVPTQNITTITFGTPSTWDFEIGQLVADTAKVKNITINVRNIKWTEQMLVNTAKRTCKPVPIFEKAVNLYCRDKVDDDNPVYWSGYMGDPIAGSHLTKYELEGWNEAVEIFVRNNCITKLLTPSSFKPKKMMPNERLNPHIENYEQIDWSIRQPLYVKEIVCSKKSKTPFLNEKWLSYMLNVPNEERFRRGIFKKIMSKAYPGLFGLPAAPCYGWRLNDPFILKEASRIKEAVKSKVLRLLNIDYTRKSTNYISFESEFRKNLKTLVKKQLRDLKNRNVIAESKINKIWRDHMAGMDMSSELRLLVSVESYLKSGKMYFGNM
jgi:hypothetical protein